MEQRGTQGSLTPGGSEMHRRIRPEGTKKARARDCEFVSGILATPHFGITLENRSCWFAVVRDEEERGEQRMHPRSAAPRLHPLLRPTTWPPSEPLCWIIKELSAYVGACVEIVSIGEKTDEGDAI